MPSPWRRALGDWRAEFLWTLSGAFHPRGVTGPVHPADQMFSGSHPEHYQKVGEQGLELIRDAWREIQGAPDGTPRVLDFGCGFGRVLRHLSDLGPVLLVAADRQRAAVDFCQHFLDVEGIWLRPGRPLSGGPYDLVWAGSVFTHLPPVSFVDHLQELLDCCRKGGVVLITTHGAGCLDHSDLYPVPLPEAGRARARLNKEGILHIGYPWEPGYGVTLVDPHWVIRTASPRGTLLWHRERGWDGHQDVFCFQV